VRHAQRHLAEVALSMARALLAALLFIASPAHAARYALLVGANEGPPDLPVLRYAERDATKMADVLERLGGVPPENIIVLRSPVAAELDRALASLAARMDAAEPNLLTFYYSGHADRAQLHLAHSTYAYGELKRALRALPVTLTIMLVDACRAGGLITAKGARVFAVDPGLALDDDAARVEGLAILTSSSVDEASQESDRLGGGVFTHQLVSGLSGAADANDDGRVTLTELQAHAYAQTLDFTSTTELVQHPAFAFDLRGHDDPVLTTLDAAARGALVFPTAGHYVVLESSGPRQLVSELTARAAANLLVRPGQYTVRRLTRDAAFEGRVVVAAGARAAVDPDQLQAIPYRHAIRKGYGLVHRAAWSIGLAAELTSPLLDSDGPLLAGALTAQLDVPAASLALRLRYAHGARDDGLFVSYDESLVGLDASAWHLFDVSAALGVGFGVRLGCDWLHQSFDAYGAAPPVDTTAPRVGSFARAELALGGSVALTLDVGVEVYLFAKAVGEATTTTTSSTLVGVTSLGLMVRVP